MFHIIIIHAYLHILYILVHFTIVCSKGTYIRSLASDFGKALNNGAHLSSLRRERIGEYSLAFLE